MVRQMKKVILTIMIIILTILNIMLFRDYYKNLYNTNYNSEQKLSVTSLAHAHETAKAVLVTV